MKKKLFIALISAFVIVQVLLPLRFYFDDYPDYRYSWQMFAGGLECSAAAQLYSGQVKILEYSLATNQGSNYLNTALDALCTYASKRNLTIQVRTCEFDEGFLKDLAKKRNICDGVDR